MLALGSSVAGKYVHVALNCAPAAGAVENGALMLTVEGPVTAATNRISPLNATACPGTSPCAPANTSDVPSDPAPAIPAPLISGCAPRQAWNIAPYAGACPPPLQPVM